MYKICFYVPEKNMESVKQALFDAGAGKIGNYDSCCWQSAGTGQFKPLENSNPVLGKQGELEVIDEYKIEMVCTDDCIDLAVTALKNTHPYETPAYDIWKLEDLANPASVR